MMPEGLYVTHNLVFTLCLTTQEHKFYACSLLATLVLGLLYFNVICWVNSPYHPAFQQSRFLHNTISKPRYP